MAVSPLPPRSDDGQDAKRVAQKAKVLPVRSNSGDGVSPSAGKQESESELGDQLNQRVRDKYVKDKKIGEGTYAVVFKGHVKDKPKELVAIKKIKIVSEYQDGIPPDALREMKFLQELSHANIIALHDVFLSKNVNLVLEFLPLGDLEALIRDHEGVRYGTADIKAWMGMLGRAIWFCHANFVLHRDIKPNNLMIAADGEIRLADFGLARSFADPYRPMSHEVITRWYRPPELLYGAKFYSSTVDMWSVGLVFAELILRVPFLAGDTDMQQLELICKNIGSPTEENWPGVTTLPNYVKGDTFVPLRGRDYFESIFRTVGPLGVELLMSTMVLDPRKRVKAEQFLKHKWWTADPRPTEKQDLPRKAGGAEKMGSDMGKRPGLVEDNGSSSLKVARKLDYGSAR